MRCSGPERHGSAEFRYYGRSPHLVRAEAFPEALSAALWVATHKDMVGSAKVRSILSWFVEVIRTDANLFEGRHL